MRNYQITVLTDTQGNAFAFWLVRVFASDRGEPQLRRLAEEIAAKLTTPNKVYHVTEKD